MRFVKDAKFTGKSGYDHKFDFSIAASKIQPERFLNAIKNPDKQHASLMIFSWTDIKNNRPKDAKAYAMLNDQEKPVGQDIVRSLQMYGIEPVPWSKRDRYVEKLAA